MNRRSIDPLLLSTSYRDVKVLQVSNGTADATSASVESHLNTVSHLVTVGALSSHSLLRCSGASASSVKLLNEPHG